MSFSGHECLFNKFLIKKLLFFILLFIFLPSPAPAEQLISVILSKEIIPYHKAIEGVKNKMSGFRFKEHNLENESARGENILHNLETENPSLILAVGPEAANLLKNFDTPSLRVFTMILNPEKVFSDTIPFSGVSMNYPPAYILSLLKKAFPEREKVGIFFSPELNANLVEQFKERGEKDALIINPFPISSSAEIRSILKSPVFAPDLMLFIPDRLVITEKLINYIIEECLFRKIPAIGFNTWFARNGALMAFYLDYKEIGEQTGELALKLLENRGGEPLIEAPRKLRIILNLRLARKFNFKISEEIKAYADQVIE